ncbi:cutinase [Mycobacterium gallinarum]|uniref:Cutinase n=1 Tax=Mycobacterium gallinarum TaxID=39689 RepID=A0A9W4FGU1_9MYCO|nr:MULTISPECIES: cutinase family protein [Mycobacterium]MDV3131666.1 cutinase family protein [Mycobacterium sp. 29Ha]BBY94391.1 cutinase [Mycobacterium gallinarum]
MATDAARLRRLPIRLLAAALTVAAISFAPNGIPTATAQGCPDIEVIFARGTNDPPGIGLVGQGFVDALRPKVAPRSVGVYAVNYAATFNFLRAADGATDANNHAQFMANTCPNTKLVLGGFSQGAAVVDLMLGVAPNVSAISGVSAIPGLNAIPGLDLNALARPMPPDVANRVAAVAVFGNPLGRVMGPLNVLSPGFGARTIDLCNPQDPICDTGDLSNRAPHHQYVPGMTDQAATFVAGLV